LLLELLSGQVEAPESDGAPATVLGLAVFKFDVEG
jgi:hypothetical protein